MFEFDHLSLSSSDWFSYEIRQPIRCVIKRDANATDVVVVASRFEDQAVDCLQLLAVAVARFPCVEAAHSVIELELLDAVRGHGDRHPGSQTLACGKPSPFIASEEADELSTNQDAGVEQLNRFSPLVVPRHPAFGVFVAPDHYVRDALQVFGFRHQITRAYQLRPVDLRTLVSMEEGGVFIERDNVDNFHRTILSFGSCNGAGSIHVGL